MAKRKPGPKPSDVGTVSTGLNLDADLRDALDRYIESYYGRERIRLSMSRAVNRLLRVALEKEGLVGDRKPE